MVELSKGANTWLTEHDVIVDVNFPSGTTDMDLYTVLVRTHGSAGSDQDLVFFNQPNSVCGSVTTTGSTVQLRLDRFHPR